MKAANSRTGCSAWFAGTATKWLGGAHVDTRGVQVQLGQPRRFCAALACAHHSLHDYRVGVSPEGVTDNVQSPERDRLGRGVTNDAVVRLPDHATKRAIRTSVLSVLVRTTRLVKSLQVGPNFNS